MGGGVSRNNDRRIMTPTHFSLTISSSANAIIYALYDLPIFLLSLTQSENTFKLQYNIIDLFHVSCDHSVIYHTSLPHNIN